MSRYRVVAFLGLLAFAGLGAFAGWHARGEYEQEEAAIAEAVEREIVYGVPVDHGTPWSPNACAGLAADVERAHAAQEAGGRKSLFMESMARRLDPSAPTNAEAMREIADAWARYIDGLTFLQECIARLTEARS